MRMESHEWNERDEEGKRHYYRANYLGGKWRVLTTQIKREPVWDVVEHPAMPIWEALREIIWNKYQRKRLPWERVAEIDRLMGKEPEPEGKYDGKKR